MNYRDNKQDTKIKITIIQRIKYVCFNFSYEGGDGTKISSQGELRNFSNDATGEAVSGSVFYKVRN